MKKFFLFISFFLSISAYANQNKQSVFLCQNSNLQTHWTNGQCKNPYKSIAHYKVPLNLRFNDQVYIAKMKHEKAQSRKGKRRSSSTLVIGHTKPAKLSQYCRNIENQLEQLRQTMNLPQTTQSMNSLDGRRQRLINKKMRDCM